jgi:4-hydroxybutyrate dehydrogenase
MPERTPANPLLDQRVVIANFGKVQFGFGALASIGAELAELGLVRPILATERRIAELGLLDKVAEHIRTPRGMVKFDALPGQPTVAGVERLAADYVDNHCDCIIALGGGAVIDMCKAAAVLTGNPPPLQQYVDPSKITRPVAPILAIPTTAGTGSEVTRAAGIHPAPGQREFGVRGPQLLPRVAICDPDLTLSLPPKLTAGTGMDALGHCIEGFLSPTVNPVVDAIALDGMRRVVAYIERAVADGGDKEARWHMLMAAVEGGMAISKGLGCAHALSMTFSDSEVHHGAAVSVSMPIVLRFLGSSVGDKLGRLAEAVGAKSGAQVADAVAALNDRIGLPRTVRELGYHKNDHEELAAYAAASHFNRTSPRSPSLAEYRHIIAELLA